MKTMFRHCMIRHCTALVALTLVSATIALAQSQTQTPAAAPANPLVADQKAIYGYASDLVVRSAEKMPEANYAFKAAPDVRSYGQIIRHVADAQVHVLLGRARREKPGDGVVSQIEIFALGGERTSGYWSHRQCHAQIVSNLTVQRRLKLF